MVHITPLFFCLKVRYFLSTWKADYCCECRCCLVCLMGILGKPSNPNVGSYKSRGQYKESFLTSSLFWFDGFSQYCFPRSGEPRRIQVQPWRSQWPCRAGSGYLAVTQAVLGPLPAPTASSEHWPWGGLGKEDGSVSRSSHSPLWVGN